MSQHEKRFENAGPGVAVPLSLSNAPGRGKWQSTVVGGLGRNGVDTVHVIQRIHTVRVCPTLARKSLPASPMSPVAAGMAALAARAAVAASRQRESARRYAGDHVPPIITGQWETEWNPAAGAWEESRVLGCR